MTREQYIKLLIAEKGMTEKAFAKEIGIAYSTFRSLLMNGVGGTSVDNAIKICKGLGITIEMLNKCGEDNRNFPISAKERAIIVAYRSQPTVQLAVDRALGINDEDFKETEKRA